MVFSACSRLSPWVDRKEGAVTCSISAASRSTEEPSKRRLRGSTPNLAKR